MSGAWGPETWGPSPQEEAAARRAEERARNERAPGFFGWLSAHPWAWALFLLAAAFVVLGPWLHVLTPTAAGLQSFLCHNGRYAQQCIQFAGAGAAAP